MLERFTLVTIAIIGLCAAADSNATAPVQKPLDWRELLTVAQKKPRTDLMWGTDAAKVVELHPELRKADEPMPSATGFFLSENVTDSECSFVFRAGSDQTQALSLLILELPRDAPAKCGQAWQAALRSLYGKPTSSGPVQDLIVDEDTELSASWDTPTSCIRLRSTRPDAPHPTPFTVTFGDRSTIACGYDDQIVVTKPRKK